MNLLKAQDAAWTILVDTLLHENLKHVCIMVRKDNSEFYVITDLESLQYHSKYSHLVGYYSSQLRRTHGIYDIRYWMYSQDEYHA